MIPPDHMGTRLRVRLLEEIFDALDWSPWNGRYVGAHGQPPVPPLGARLRVREPTVRMAAAEGKKIYARRLHVLWACTAYNRRKLMSSMEILRACGPKGRREDQQASEGAFERLSPSVDGQRVVLD